MDVLSGLLFIVRAIFGSLFAAVIFTPIVYVLRSVLPKPSRLFYQFVTGFAYLLLFAVLAHAAYFSSYFSCPHIPELPDWDVDCPALDIGEILSNSLTATLVLAPYLFIFFAASFFVYSRISFNSIFLRTYLAVLTFLVVMLLWVVVFPWSLERYLQLFY